MSVLFISIGMLTKVTFLPYVFILLAVFLFHERKNFRLLPSAAVALFSPFRRKTVVLLMLCMLFMAADANLYIGNLIKYGKLKPGMDKVLGLEQAMQHRIFARGHVVRLFRQGKISYTEAKEMAIRNIKHLGDRQGALLLLETAAREKAANKKSRIDRFRYAFVWADLMLGKIFGIMGHLSMEKRGTEKAPYFLIFFAAGGLLVRRMRVVDLHGTGIYLLIIAVFYALILMQLINYKSYFNYGIIVLGLQGRYIFPVLVPIYVLTAYYLAGSGSKRWQWGTFITVAAFFVHSEFPWFMGYVSPYWFFR